MITSHFIELGMAYLLAAMMPGPSVTLIIKNGILYSRAASIQACLGTIIGTALQSGVILIGLIFVDNNSIFLKIIKILCSLYLIYLGLKIFWSKKTEILKSNETLSDTFNLRVSSMDTKFMSLDLPCDRCIYDVDETDNTDAVNHSNLDYIGYSFTYELNITVSYGNILIPTVGLNLDAIEVNTREEPDFPIK